MGQDPDIAADTGIKSDEIIDEPGSMRLNTDSVDPKTNEPLTRWWEAHHRLKEMIEIIAYVPFEQIGIEFLNRTDRIVLTKQGRSPREFLNDAYAKIDTVFHRSPP